MVFKQPLTGGLSVNACAGDIEVESQLNGALDEALRKTAEKSRLNGGEFLAKIGSPSQEHTNFRLFLSPHIAKIMASAIPIKNAWVHTIEPTQVAASPDAAGSGSACDWATGVNLPLIFEVEKKDGNQIPLVHAVNKALVAVLNKRGIVVNEDYIQADFITADDIASRRGIAIKVTPYAQYPADKIWPTR